jgi:hypothetical protein
MPISLGKIQESKWPDAAKRHQVVEGEPYGKLVIESWVEGWRSHVPIHPYLTGNTVNFKVRLRQINSGNIVPYHVYVYRTHHEGLTFNPESGVPHEGTEKPIDHFNNIQINPFEFEIHDPMIFPSGEYSYGISVSGAKDDRRIPIFALRVFPQETVTLSMYGVGLTVIGGILGAIIS